MAVPHIRQCMVGFKTVPLEEALRLHQLKEVFQLLQFYFHCYRLTATW